MLAALLSFYLKFFNHSFTANVDKQRSKLTISKPCKDGSENQVTLGTKIVRSSMLILFKYLFSLKNDKWSERCGRREEPQGKMILV